jgi:hypothetical protein
MDACQLRLVEVAELFEVMGVRHYFVSFRQACVTSSSRLC